MTPHQFIAKWKPADLKERAACQEHFLDLCAVLGEPTPAAADPTGSWYTFEKGVSKDTGGQGFADVWRRNCFGWEYKGKKKNLTDAYRQLCQYRESLLNPPLLVVCDLNRFEIHTNFPNTAKEVHAFDLDGLADPLNVGKLKAAFTDPDKLKPGRTQKQVTEEVAKTFAAVAEGMQARGVEPHAAGRFLMKLMFCMFAEDIELLPKDLFLRTLRNTKADPGKLSKLLTSLFEAMANQGGTFGADEIPWVNGGLFHDAVVIDLAPAEIRHLEDAATHDWSAVEPSIFGTLFERILNPEKRSQLGAHYTGIDDIRTLLDPVLMAPLRAEWEVAKAKADKLWDKVEDERREARRAKQNLTKKEEENLRARLRRAETNFEKVVETYLARLEKVTILDPACGSGNFLYVALRLLLDLEKEVITYAATHEINRFPFVRPTQLRGIELSPYAQELAQVVIWIGFLQWMKANGFSPPNDPVLDPMENIENRDAVLDLSDPANPKEPDWPDAEFIVGNPPFLGDKKMRAELGDEYVEYLRSLYAERVPGGADFVAYWFEKARSQIADDKSRRAGLIATQSIRVGANRQVLKRIKDSGDIFMAWSDRPWVLEGAAVRVSIVGFDSGAEKHRELNGSTVPVINADLTHETDLTTARRLSQNANRAFVGTQKGGNFEISLEEALNRLRSSGNPNGRPNSDVVRPWANGMDVTRRPRDMYIIDFGASMTVESAALYESPFEYVKCHVQPARAGLRRENHSKYWWIHAESRPGMRRSLSGRTRYIATPRVATHRVFVWLSDVTLPDSRLFLFAFDEDWIFGILHSKVHERWSLATSPRHGVGNDPTYNAMSCFETFPFPEPTDAERAAITEAAEQLDTLRNSWLNPHDWVRTEVLEFPGSVDGPWKRFVVDADARGIGTVKYPRIVPKDAATEKELKKRTLTNLYNARPAWLANAHATLDAAVLAAYGWPADISDADLLAKLLDLNLSRASATTDGDEETSEAD
jgi:type II restriction/modification system DNA methylase subunit YeeA